MLWTNQLIYPRHGDHHLPSKGRRGHSPALQDLLCNGRSSAHIQSRCPLPPAGSQPTLDLEFSCSVPKTTLQTHPPFYCHQTPHRQTFHQPCRFSALENLRGHLPSVAPFLQTGTPRPGAEWSTHRYTAPSSGDRPMTALFGECGQCFSTPELHLPLSH